jgi:glucokinase
MSILALDLGGTKLATGIFRSTGDVAHKAAVPIGGRDGAGVGDLIKTEVEKALSMHTIEAIGVSVPGISRQSTGTVWAPNIEGWEDYPLLGEIKKISGSLPVYIDSDRACSIFGEQWQGNAKGFRDAIFMAVGTGIGAGIVTNGHLLRGAHDIAGAVGWMALSKPFERKYAPCGCFEFHASGAGIPKFTQEVMQERHEASGLRDIAVDELTARHVFAAYDRHDPVARIVVLECISYWGMASANLVSIFNPQKIIFGGGIFGPAAKFINEIKAEAKRWAQPISIAQVAFEHSALGSDAALYGAAFLTLRNTDQV